MLRTLAAVSLVLLFAVPPSAHSEPREGWGGHSPRGDARHHHRQHRPYDPAAAFWGGLLGGWLWSQAQQPPPQVIIVPEEREVQEMLPESNAWYRYCAEKYRSFDGASGTYMGFDGERHRCVIR